MSTKSNNGRKNQSREHSERSDVANQSDVSDTSKFIGERRRTGEQRHDHEQHAGSSNVSQAPYDRESHQNKSDQHDDERSQFANDDIGDTDAFARAPSYQGKGFFGGSEAPYERGTAHVGSGRSVGYGPVPQTSGLGFRGKGPKGYRRSDERLTEEISDRLTFDDNIDASDLSVVVENGEVTLSGTVNSRQEKRLAEDIAEDVGGIAHVQNNLHLKKSAGE